MLARVVTDNCVIFAPVDTLSAWTFAVIRFADEMLARVVTDNWVDTLSVRVLLDTTLRVCTLAVVRLALTRFDWVRTVKFPVATIFETEIEFETAKLVKRPTVVMLDWDGVASEPMIDPFRFEIPVTFRVHSVPTEVTLVWVFWTWRVPTAPDNPDTGTFVRPAPEPV